MSTAQASAVERLNVGSDTGGYPVVIGGGLLKTAGEELRDRFGGARRVAVLCDTRVAELHLETLRESLADAEHKVSLHTIPPGEEQKSFAGLESTCRELLRADLDRNSVILALGGGVIGDLGGLCAALLLRGVACVQAPTTLLAQVDSSIGGKTAIDTPEGKNLVGAFHNPSLVLCDTDTLATLPPRELAAGFAEIVKAGLGLDAEFFTWLEKNAEKIIAGDSAALRRAILTACACKARVVSADGKERDGARALLNLGHTFAHGLETALGYDGRLLHGEAVAAGLVLAARLSERTGVAAEDARLAERATRILKDANLPADLRGDVFADLSAVEILAAMRYDKKRAGGTTRFVLLRGVGEAFFPARAADDTVLAVLEESLGRGAKRGDS
ncbi:MAG: 3-dehydroquinate synthase [Alphaproteobacteria bacterium]|nr:3-dehydroquinate synthase [Alphaproteobacteria bacterium]MDA8003608.1 3-dehydroquinate synthase [Alphaproteobacteria bacterium]MDA8005621.1 3-dehydroquinate synthase [Alphaproteobacteria bacterium]MDA8013146.1 3-dehydroquinate synthase [Alphaproteobacteria bacterium]